MSAFLVTKNHIDYIVTAALSARYMRVENETAFGQMLLTENHKSVNARYNEVNAAVPYRFTRSPGKIDPVVALKAIHCLQYQSCETDGWKDSEACKLLEQLEGEMIRLLPGYEEAPWAID